MKPEILLQWFTEDLLPIVVKSGRFAENDESQTFVKCEFEATENYISSFASAACFAKLKLKTDSEGIVTRDVLIKFQSQDEVFREKMRTERLFENEVTFYNEGYPNFVEFLKSCGKNPDFINKMVPKCYFASNGDGDLEKAVVILKDLRSSGFRLSDSVVDLDLKHCLLTVEKLAEFHSVSFAMKFKGWKPLEKLKNSFVDVWLEDRPICREQSEVYLSYVSNRGIDYLLSQKNSEVPREYLDNLKRMLKPMFELKKSLATPKEPLSVICHGDFNRNNILYRYENGEPVDAVVIDYQRTVWGSPNHDLGFLIYMNTNLEFREKHFEQVFEHYYRCLIRNTATILNESEKSIADRIPIQAFRDDFGRVAMCHYTIVSFFLPFMMAPSQEDFESELKNYTLRESAERNYKQGGEVVSERIAEVIVDFYRRKFYM